VPEEVCNACGGSGVQMTPVPGYDERGNPVIDHVYSACIGCNGLGRIFY